MAKKKFYAVRKGYKTGIFETWDECKAQVNGYKGAEYKSFPTKEEAGAFIGINNKKLDDTKNCIEAYVDGSYEHLYKKYGSGAVFIKDGEVIHKASFGGNEENYVSMRNVAGEIKAAEYAMQYCIDNGEKNLILYYDYQGISKWCTGEWKANKEGTIKYRDYYKSIEGKLNVKFVKVLAHSGNKYNDVADSLAKEGLLK